MRLVPVSPLLDGQMLAKNIFNDNGQILLHSKVMLTSSLIKRLLQYNILYIYIEDDRTDDIIVKDIVSEETRQKALSRVHTTMSTLFNEQKCKPKLTSPKLAKEFNALFDDILGELSDNKQIMSHMVNIHRKDDYLYHHSVNVGILSAALGMALGYNNNDIRELGIGAMLHDIGKTKIPIDILNKPGKLTEEEFQIMKKHSEYGYDILKHEPGISLRTAHIAFQHHERYNGTGYPRQIINSDQHEFAKIVAITDVYDALISNRIYRTSYLPHEAFEMILGGGNYHFDHNIIKAFSENISIYPIGITVKLNTGELAVVSNIDANYPQRPTVRIISAPNGDNISAPYEIDLKTNLTVMIASVSIH
jgi:putative nucleotidyltransferase with HDIG domain